MAGPKSVQLDCGASEWALKARILTMFHFPCSDVDYGAVLDRAGTSNIGYIPSHKNKTSSKSEL